MQQANLSPAIAAVSQSADDMREPVLDPVERVCELCFGLFMALTFVGAVSVATEGEDPHNVMFYTALGCNLAWGLADGVMYLVRTVTDRARRFNLGVTIRRESDPARGVQHLRGELTRVMKSVVTDAELEAVRARMATLPLPQSRPRLRGRDFVSAAAIFAMVVLGTFPVALPFLLFSETPTAMLVSRVLTLAMLFACGLSLGRHSGGGGVKAGIAMIVVGVLLVAGIIALGG